MGIIIGGIGIVFAALLVYLVMVLLRSDKS